MFLGTINYVHNGFTTQQIIKPGETSDQNVYKSGENRLMSFSSWLVLSSLNVNVNMRVEQFKSKCFWIDFFILNFNDSSHLFASDFISTVTNIGWNHYKPIEIEDGIFHNTEKR